MRIRQIFNNNVVSAVNDLGEEVIIMGRSIGFTKKKGDIVPKHQVEKVFSLTPQSNDKFKQLLEGIAFEHLQISDEIIMMAKQSIGKRFSENIYITLTDHISYALERYQQGIILKNAMLFEIKRFYAPEFAAGQKALQMIREQFDVELDEDEAGFIALHFVNAELDTSMEDMKNLTSMIRNVLKLVSFHFQMDFDESSLDYSRFVTHLRYLGQRMFKGNGKQFDYQDLGELVQTKYPKAYQCAEKVTAYLEKQYHVIISEDDTIFLAVHIQRLTKPGSGGRGSY